MKDRIELPPLPEPDQYTWYSRNFVESIRKAAVEADRKQRHLKEEAQLEREWAQLRAMQAQIEADRQHRGEPVAEVQLHAHDASTTVLRPLVDFEPSDVGKKLYLAPQPAEPTDEVAAMEAVIESIDPATWPGLTSAQRCALGRFAKPQPAKPVKSTRPDGGIDADGFFAQLEAEKPAEPTVADFQALLALAARIERADGEPIPVSVEAASLIRGMLSRYGQPTQPAASAGPKSGGYSVEWHGDGYAIYLGRDSRHHGANLAHLTECTPEFAGRIAKALNSAPVAAQPSVPEGWRLVPIERSYDMRAKAIIAYNTAVEAGQDRDDALGAAFLAELEAAPTPPAGANEGYSREWCMKMAQLEADAGYPDQTILNPPAAGQAQGWDTQVIRDILAERELQVQTGYDSDHDDEHVFGEIAAMAAYYMLPPAVRDWPAAETGYGDTFGEAIIPEGWQVSPHHSRRVELVRAVAMGLAEIERLDRAAMKETKP